MPMTLEQRQKIAAARKASVRKAADDQSPVTIPAAAPSLTEQQAFTTWMRSREGMDASDPRLPADYGRLVGVIEDKLRAAFAAGWRGRRG